MPEYIEREAILNDISAAMKRRGAVEIWSSGNPAGASGRRERTRAASSGRPSRNSAEAGKISDPGHISCSWVSRGSMRLLSANRSTLLTTTIMGRVSLASAWATGARSRSRNSGWRI